MAWWRGVGSRTKLGRRRSAIRGHQSRQVDEPAKRRGGDSDLAHESGYNAATGRDGAGAKYVLPKRTPALSPNAATLQAHPEATRGCVGSTYQMRHDRYADEQANQVLANLEKEVDEDQAGRWLVKFFQNRINRADT
jgi:hypothetical protein